MDRESILRVQLQQPNRRWVDVGLLHNLREINWFEISDAYWELPDRPVLGQIFEEAGKGWRPSARVALPNWFSHILPEGGLRQAVANAAHTNSKREFNLLALIGKDDLPGALRISRAPSPVGWTEVPDDEPADIVTPEDPLLKFSLAGTQLKFSVYGGAKGLAVPARGQAGNVILKFPDGRPEFAGVPEAELACLRLADRIGIPTPEAWLSDPGEVPGLEDWASRNTGLGLAVKRFDRRDDNSRVHMEEFAQILNAPAASETAKYRRANFETVASFAGALCRIAAVGEVVDRIVLNILVGNGDAHLKNWAIVYADGRTPVLSPLYDVLPTVLYIPKEDMGLKLAGSRRFESVSLASFDILGERSEFGAQEARLRAKEAVNRVVAGWSVLRDHLSNEQYALLTRRRDSLRLVRDAG